MPPEAVHNVGGIRAVIHTIVSGLAGANVAHGTPLLQAGLDSLALVELRNELSRCAACMWPAKCIEHSECQNCNP